MVNAFGNLIMKAPMALPKILKNNNVFKIISRSANIKATCRDGRDRPQCYNPCRKAPVGECHYKVKPPPCPKKICCPPIHTCPYDDPCFHCPYTPPPCPKMKDACCRQARCPPDNPYIFKDICCRKRNPKRIVDKVCGPTCIVQNRGCCPCSVCQEACGCNEFKRFETCEQSKPPILYNRCMEEYGEAHCPHKPCCEIKYQEKRQRKVCPRQRWEDCKGR